ncbi:MAG: hypothetical protein KBT10_00835, partial [Bacteroidales bacterium]|nr:hypothetical protein [Candidatus Sodaliphilus aphodohippi]
VIVSVVSGNFYIFAARIMKTVLHILVIAFMACFVAACGGHADRASLVAIDSLILQDPDSACGMLAAYPADSLTTDDDRAYHALLTTIADYKAYRPATTDSAINIAVNHYDHDGANTDHRMRSLLYKGCVMEELGDPEQAIEYYKRAETNCPSDDYFHIGYINMRIATLYQYAYNDSIAISQFKKAAKEFKKVGDKHYETFCLNSLGILYCQSENFDSAEIILEQGLSLSKEADDSVNIIDAYTALCDMYYEQGKYHDVVDVAKQLFSMCTDTEVNRSNYYISSISFSKLGYPDSAEKYLKHAPKPLLVEDSISEMRAIAELAMAKGDLKNYIRHNNIAVNMADSMLLLNQVEKIKEAEAKYDLAQNEVAHLTRQRQLIFIITSLSFLVTIAVFCVLLYRRREKYARQELEEAISQVSASRQKLEQVLKENHNRLHELKDQEEQLHQMQLLLQQMRDTRNDDLDHIEEQLVKTKQALAAAEHSIKIQDMTRSCFDDILRAVFYSGQYNSDQVIDNDSILIMKPEFWTNLFELVSLKHNDFYAHAESQGIELNEIEKKLIALSVANVPSAIIRRILDFKNIRIVTNRRQKLAKKITGRYSSFDEIFH